jgi:TolB protein
MFRFGLAVLVSLLAGAGAGAQDASASLGIFESQNDVGHVLHPGSAEYDTTTKTYTVSGSGENMWFASDEFHFVWKKISAPDVTLTANISILGASGDGHRKGVLMIRQTLDGDSAYVDAARHGDGLTSLQFRDGKGAVTREIESNVSGPARLRIEKQGDRFYLWIAGENEDLQFAGGSARVEMHAPFYVGIGVCAHQKDALEKVAFTNVDLNTSVNHPKTKYSTVETVLQSTDARSGYVSRKHLTSPGWSADGQALTFEIDGQRQQTPFTPLKTAAPVGAPVTAQPEDKFVYFASNQNGSMQIERKRADGSQPEQMTSDDFNNVSPHLSPDGKSLLFLSYSKDLQELQENKDVALRMMSLADKRIKTLATFVGGPGSLGTQPWSPDGRRVVFISYQSME